VRYEGLPFAVVRLPFDLDGALACRPMIKMT
jgi:hypothetical protein